MSSHLVPVERIEGKIFSVRGKKVMVDYDLAELYEVTTGNLNKAVKRNIERFPEDFMFQLTEKEYESLRFQFGSLKRGQHSKYLPYVFTQNGVAMLSGVLHSRRAVQVNIAIMRAFTQLREMLLSHKDLEKKIEEMESKYDYQFRVVFDQIRRLLKAPRERFPEIKGFVKEKN
jgi:phage regulator Rha-like protein